MQYFASQVEDAESHIDWAKTYHLSDPSRPESMKGFTVNLFSKAVDWLPDAEVGQILILRSLLVCCSPLLLCSPLIFGSSSNFPATERRRDMQTVQIDMFGRDLMKLNKSSTRIRKSVTERLSTPFGTTRPKSDIARNSSSGTRGSKRMLFKSILVTFLPKLVRNA